MRTFAAFNVSDAARKECARLIGEFRRSLSDVKWTPPENLHVTLRFFGETHEDRIGELRDMVASAAAKQGRFNARLGHAGVFPNVQHARVIWVGLEEGAHDSSGLAARMEEGARQIGFAPEKRPYVPHLTIGRMRSARVPGKLAEFIARSECHSASFWVESVVLYRSTLTNEGSVYEVLGESRLD